MKLDWLRADIASARRASALLVLLLACSMLANVTLAAFAMHMAGRERVVVVPPSINKTFWVESERVQARSTWSRWGISCCSSRSTSRRRAWTTSRGCCWATPHRRYTVNSRRRWPMRPSA